MSQPNAIQLSTIPGMALGDYSPRQDPPAPALVPAATYMQFDQPAGDGPYIWLKTDDAGTLLDVLIQT